MLELPEHDTHVLRRVSFAKQFFTHVSSAGMADALTQLAFKKKKKKKRNAFLLLCIYGAVQYM